MNNVGKLNNICYNISLQNNHLKKKESEEDKIRSSVENDYSVSKRKRKNHSHFILSSDRQATTYACSLHQASVLQLLVKRRQHKVTRRRAAAVFVVGSYFVVAVVFPTEIPPAKFLHRCGLHRSRTQHRMNESTIHIQIHCFAPFVPHKALRAQSNHWFAKAFWLFAFWRRHIVVAFRDQIGRFIYFCFPLSSLSPIANENKIYAANHSK